MNYIIEDSYFYSLLSVGSYQSSTYCSHIEIPNSICVYKKEKKNVYTFMYICAYPHVVIGSVFSSVNQNVIKLVFLYVNCFS